jgi:Na+/melibiose symporter-like transporter
MPMSEIDTPVEGVATGGETADSRVDPLRLRSFVGLVLGLIGPRANLAVSGILLTLLVSHRTGANALAVSFALSSNQLIGWLAYPVFGRASDRTRSAVGRRAPYMASGLFVMGACTYSYTLVGGYWPIVALIGAVRLASVVGGLTNIAVVPEVFGKSRTLKAAAIIGVLGTALGLVIKGTVIATWKQSDPSTWNLPFRVAGIVMIAVSVAVLILVREVPAARKMADRDRTVSRPWHAELRDLLSSPNGKVLLGGVFLFWAGVTATGSLAIVYFEKILHAGAVTQTILGWATGGPALLIGVPVGYLISRVLTRKQVAILMPALGAVLSVLQYFVHAIWQSVILGFVSAPLLSAFVISLAPMLLQLLPRSGGFGELLGKFVAPFSLAGIAFSLLAALAVNETGNYRTIWLFPAAAGVLQAIIMCWLWVPEGQAHVRNQGIGNRFVDSVYDQIMDGNRKLFGGQVTSEDADGASLFASARNLLGNPYALVASIEGLTSHKTSDEPPKASGDPAPQDTATLGETVGSTPRETAPEDPASVDPRPMDVGDAGAVAGGQDHVEFPPDEGTSDSRQSGEPEPC